MDEKRPVLKLNYSVFEKIMEIIAVSALVISLTIILIYWSSIPNKIPTHFGISGKPDAWGSKNSLFGLPIISGLLFIMLSIISKFPHIYNYTVTITNENAESQYRNSRSFIICIKAEIMCMFTYILWRSILVALEKSSGLGLTFLPIYLVVIFGSLIYFITKSIKLK